MDQNKAQLVDGTPLTGAFVLPSGTTAERPSSPVNGMIRYNTTLNITEQYADGAWTAPADRLIEGSNSLEINASNNLVWSGGDVGINTVSPDAPLTIQESGDVQIRLKNSSGTTKAFIGTAGAFGSGSTDDLRIRSEGNILFGSVGSEKFRITSGGGITFNGDTAAANALDDYEEGSYTPTYIGSGGAGTVAYQSGQQQGFYVKIGKWVTVWVDMTITSASGQSGVARVTMPFTSQTDLGATNYWMGSFVPWDINNNFTNSKMGTGWMSRGVDYFSMYSWAAGTNTGHGYWQLNTTGRIAGTFTYVTNT